jgi:hypothetical protein
MEARRTQERWSWHAAEACGHNEEVIQAMVVCSMTSRSLAAKHRR